MGRHLAGDARIHAQSRGLGPPFWQWLPFKVYWSAWAFLLAVGGTLLWVRGDEISLRMRLQIARRRFTHQTAWLMAGAVVAILSAGGYISALP